MAQQQDNRERFAGRFMIQDADHMSQIPQVDGKQQARQAEQGQSGSRQQGGQVRQDRFDYQNPRQVF